MEVFLCHISRDSGLHASLLTGVHCADPAFVPLTELPGWKRGASPSEAAFCVLERPSVRNLTRPDMLLQCMRDGAIPVIVPR